MLLLLMLLMLLVWFMMLLMSFVFVQLSFIALIRQMCKSIQVQAPSERSMNAFALRDGEQDQEEERDTGQHVQRDHGDGQRLVTEDHVHHQLLESFTKRLGIKLRTLLH